MSRVFTPAEFAKHLEDTAKKLGGVEHVESMFHGAMVRACVLVQGEAQKRIGTGHRAVGPFPAWAPLKPATQDDRERKGFARNKPLLRTGELAGSIEFKIEGHTGHVGSNDPVAVYQELGTARIPARSFLGAAAFINEGRVHRLFMQAVLRSFKLAPEGSVDIAGMGRPVTMTLPQ